MKINTLKKVAVATFGCKVNQYESACIANDFQLKGYDTVPFDQDADVYIINSCTVTGRTDYKSRNAIRYALEKKKKNARIKIIVTGCYSQLNREKILQMGEIDLVVDNNQKNRIYDYLDEHETSFGNDPALFTNFAEQYTDSLFERSRAFIKIQDGCDYFCSYCTVPLARGKPRSRKPENIISQIKQLTRNGYREFVLTGINLGLYGKDLPEGNINLTWILSEIEKIEEVEQLRLSSLEPQLISQDLIAFFAKSQKLCPHLHIPLQSGSDRILSDMGRPYNTKEYSHLLSELKRHIPDIALGSDVILGLPGETEIHFQETLSFIEKLPLVYLHIFPYSRRPGTKAAHMPGIPTSAEVKPRCDQLAGLMEKKRQQYLSFLVENKIKLSGVLEQKRGNHWTALSNHYVRIYLKSDKVSKGDLISCLAQRVLFDGIEVVDND